MFAPTHSNKRPPRLSSPVSAEPVFRRAGLPSSVFSRRCTSQSHRLQVCQQIVILQAIPHSSVTLFLEVLCLPLLRKAYRGCTPHQSPGMLFSSLCGDRAIADRGRITPPPPRFGVMLSVRPNRFGQIIRSRKASRMNSMRRRFWIIVAIFTVAVAALAQNAAPTPADIDSRVDSIGSFGTVGGRSRPSGRGR